MTGFAAGEARVLNTQMVVDSAVGTGGYTEDVVVIIYGGGEGKEESVPCQVTDQTDGTYAIGYTPPVPGYYSANVLVWGRPVEVPNAALFRGNEQ